MVSILSLTHCSSVKDRDRVGVKEAKACVKAKQTSKIILDEYKILACTSNGVWIAQHINTNEIFDFLNKEYKDKNDMSFEIADLASDKQKEFLKLKTRLNKELIDIYY